MIENAAAKLRTKHLDLLVANDVSQEGAGFDVDTNIVTLLFPDGRKIALEKMSKLDVANRVLDEVVAIRNKSGVRGPGSEVETIGNSVGVFTSTKASGESDFGFRTPDFILWTTRHGKN